MTSTIESPGQIIVVPDGVPEDVTRRQNGTVEWAQSLTVTSAAEYADAATALSRLKFAAKEVESQRVAMKAPMLEGGRRIDAFFEPVRTAYAWAERTAKAKMLTYQQAENARRETERRKASEEAAAEQDRLRQESSAAFEAGDIEAAGNLAFDAELAVAVTVEAPLKVARLSTRTTWHAEIDDFELLVIAVANDWNRYGSLLNANMSALNVLAVLHHGAMPIPGVRFVSEQGLAVR